MSFTFDFGKFFASKYFCCFFEFYQLMKKNNQYYIEIFIDLINLLIIIHLWTLWLTYITSLNLIFNHTCNHTVQIFLIKKYPHPYWYWFSWWRFSNKGVNNTLHINFVNNSAPSATKKLFIFDPILSKIINATVNTHTQFGINIDNILSEMRKHNIPLAYIHTYIHIHIHTYV